MKKLVMLILGTCLIGTLLAGCLSKENSDKATKEETKKEETKKEETKKEETKKEETKKEETKKEETKKEETKKEETKKEETKKEETTSTADSYDKEYKNELYNIVKFEKNGDDIIFSYGSYAGTAIQYQGGRIVQKNEKKNTHIILAGDKGKWVEEKFYIMEIKNRGQSPLEKGLSPIYCIT